MKNKWELNPEDFDQLLQWLDKDRERAGVRYESIRSNLILLFQYWGSGAAEDLTDETLNRVARRAAELTESYEGDPLSYIRAVARHLIQEYRRKESILEPLPDNPDHLFVKTSAPEEDKDENRMYWCLEKCLAELTPENRLLVSNYYQENGGGKIQHRREMAEEMGVAANALRIRVYRIRADLEKCLKRCCEAEKKL
jgi:RNA polymerase sigma factor (sigma-70 family)